MPETTATTKGRMRSRAQWGFLFATGKPFARRWAKATPGGKGKRYRKLPGHVKKEAPLLALLKANYGAKKGQVIAGRLVRGEGGRFSSSGGAASTPPAKATPTRGKRQPPRTEAQRAADRQARQAEREQERAVKREGARAAKLTERDRILTEAGIDANLQGVLIDAMDGNTITERNGVELVKRGLAEKAADGTYRLNAPARTVMHAALRGDAGMVNDTLSKAKDRAAKLALAKPPAAGGGGGGKKKEPPVKLPARQTSRPIKPVGGGGGSGGKVPKPPAAPSQPQTSPALVALARRLSQGDTLANDEAQMLVRNGLARVVKGELVLTASGARAIRMKAMSPLLRLLARKAVLAPTRTLSAGHTGVMVALHPDKKALAAIVALPGATEPRDQLHLTLCYLGDSAERPLATNKARLIDTVRQWATAHGTSLHGTINGAGRFFHAEKDNTNAVWVAPDVAGLPELRQSLVTAIESAGFNYSQDHGFTPHITVAYVAVDAPTPPIQIDTPATFDRATLAWGDEQYDFPLGTARPKAGSSAKSFLVYKDASGALRWIARTTTAYRDRDREILPIATLDQDSQRMTATKQYGPLRWWHVGRPNALNTAQPWGAGLDLGWCDFSMQIGRTRVESGTFKDSAVAARIADTAAQYELSPGFFHAANEPDASGIFRAIHTFERSLVPIRHSRASNLFTGLTVKEHTTMDAAEQERRFQAAVTELHLTPDQAAAFAASLVATDKAASTTADPATGQPGVAFKSDDPPAAPPPGLMGTLRQWLGVTEDAPATTTKTEAAQPPPSDPLAAAVAAQTAQIAELTSTLKAAMEAPVEEEAIAEEAIVAEEEPAEGGTRTLSDLSVEEFASLLGEVLSRSLAGAMGGISDKVAQLDNEMKAMGYVRQKDDERAQQVATLKAAIEAQQAQLAELISDQPAIASVRPSQDPANILNNLKDADPTASDFEFADIMAHLIGKPGQQPVAH